MCGDHKKFSDDTKMGKSRARKILRTFSKPSTICVNSLMGGARRLTFQSVRLCTSATTIQDTISKCEGQSCKRSRRKRRDIEVTISSNLSPVAKCA